jgi:phosphoribosylaminoimidazole-succinocarboxamide synthase
MKVTDLELIRRGSSNDIYRFAAGQIAFSMTDDYSVFDVGKASDQIPGKGIAMCACAARSFEIARMIGVPTHFVQRLNERTIVVKEAQIIKDRPIIPSDENYVVPLELIYRLRVTGSILRDFISGKKKPEDYGLPAGVVPTEGTPFPYPVRMLTTKFEPIDREVGIEEACQIAGITPKDLEEYWSMIDRLNGAVAFALRETLPNLALFDGKSEVIMGPKRKKMIGDIFGTPDDRICMLDVGSVRHFSKEFLRQIHIESGYYKQLQESRAQGLGDIPIPSLTVRQLEEATKRYAYVGKIYGNWHYWEHDMNI